MQDNQHSNQNRNFEGKSKQLVIRQYNHDVKFRPEKAKAIRNTVLKQLEGYKNPKFGSFVLNNRKYN